MTRRLLIDRRVHIFGRGRAELRGEVASSDDMMIANTSPSASVDRLLLEGEVGSGALCVSSGHLRLQGCDASACAQSGLCGFYAQGPSAVADFVGCIVRGGGEYGVGGIEYGGGAKGRVEGCVVRGFREGNGIYLYEVGASPLVSFNTISDGGVGVFIRDDVDPTWSLGEGNVFANCAEGDVVDKRFPHPLPPA